MATITPTDLWEELDPNLPYISISKQQPLVYIAYRYRARSPRSISALHQASMNALGNVSRFWSQSLTAAQRLQWGTAGDVLQFRDGDNLASHPVTRFMQVQHPLLFFGLPPVDTADDLEYFNFRNLALTWADAASQLIRIDYEMQGQSLNPHRSVIHYHQVPPEDIATDNEWRYAKHLSSRDHDRTPLDVNWNADGDLAAAIYPFEPGDTVNLYIRITQCQNVNPPASKHESHLTTEDWTALTIVAT